VAPSFKKSNIYMLFSYLPYLRPPAFDNTKTCCPFLFPLLLFLFFFSEGTNAIARRTSSPNGTLAELRKASANEGVEELEEDDDGDIDTGVVDAGDGTPPTIAA